MIAREPADLSPDGMTAQPALLTVTDTDGARSAPTLYESGHPASWRRLHRPLTTGGQATDLADFEVDIATASASSEG